MKNTSYQLCSRSLLVSILLFLSSVGHAGLIKETWQANVYAAINSTGYSTGDLFTWTVIYDNESETMNEWYDGANGNADQGVGETSYRLQCTGSSITTGCYTDWSSYSILSNASYDFGNLFNQMLIGSDIASLRDPFSTNYSWVLGSSTNIVQTFKADHTQFFYGGYSYARVTGYDAAGGNTYSDIYFNQIGLQSTEDSSEVPVPTPLALLGLGLIALGFTKRKT